MLTAAILIVVSVLIAYLSAPSAENAKTAADYGIEYEDAGRRWSREPSRANGWNTVRC